jgi:hypothetical protein
VACYAPVTEELKDAREGQAETPQADSGYRSQATPGYAQWRRDGRRRIRRLLGVYRPGTVSDLPTSAPSGACPDVRESWDCFFPVPKRTGMVGL